MAKSVASNIPLYLVPIALPDQPEGVRELFRSYAVSAGTISRLGKVGLSAAQPKIRESEQGDGSAGSYLIRLSLGKRMHFRFLAAVRISSSPDNSSEVDGRGTSR